MPQMAPILWLNLFFIFLITFILFIVMNFYIIIPSKMEVSKEKIMIKEKSWKW